MPLPFTIRAAADTDLDAIWRVHRTAILHTCATHYGTDVITAWVERLKPESYRGVVQRLVVVIAEDEAEAIGFGQLDVAAGEIQAVYVLPAAQGRGVGAALLAHLEQVALSRGLGRVSLQATLNAESFYAAHGWHATGRDVRKITQQVALSCVSMEKTLG
jgi:GNAT superfamily N-acetyltransferase